MNPQSGTVLEGVQPPTLEPPTTLMVQVDEEDILLGGRGDPYECALARATRRAFHQAGYALFADGPVRVGNLMMVMFTGASSENVYDHDAGVFIDRFDHGGNVKPRTVTLTRRGLRDDRNW